MQNVIVVLVSGVPAVAIEHTPLRFTMLDYAESYSRFSGLPMSDITVLPLELLPAHELEPAQ